MNQAPLTAEFLEYALEQAHPQPLEWYGREALRVQLFDDLKRDAEDYFSASFAQGFSGGPRAALGVGAEHYAHRLLEIEGRRCIAGIRFLGGDVTRPFVELARGSRPIGSDVECDEFSRVLAEEFAIFKPARWRTYQASHLTYQFPGCEADQRLVAGLLAKINVRPLPENFNHVELRPAQNLEFYPRCAAALQEIYRERPWLPDVARLESLEDMREYLKHDCVFEIFVADAWAGVTIASRDQAFGLRGWYMIKVTLHGLGMATVVQRQLAAILEDAGKDCLYGTIGAVNLPMRKTAARVGRVELGGQFWVSFTG